MKHYLNVATILESTRLAFTNEITFPQSVANLAKTGVERYMADLTQLQLTHYSACGDAVSEPLPLIDPPDINNTWSADGVTAAVRAIQQQQIDYPQFLRRIMSAGCALYWVFIDGRQVVYFGRRGEVHVEKFPSQG